MITKKAEIKFNAWLKDVPTYYKVQTVKVFIILFT